MAYKKSRKKRDQRESKKVRQKQDSPKESQPKQAYDWSDKKIKISLGVILLVTFLAFIPTFNNEFINWDDPKYLLDNKLVKEFSFENIKKMFFYEDMQGRSLVPLSQLSFAIEYKFFGLDSMIYHLDNLLLHLLNTALVFWLILLMCKRPETAIITSLLFSLHPMHVESVAWVTERKDVLYAVFFLLALIYYLKYCSEHQAKAKYYTITLFLFILSLLSKSMAVTLPAVLILIDYFIGRKISLKKNIIEKAPFFILTVWWGIITVMGAKSVGSLVDTQDVSFFERLLYVSYGMMMYLLKLIAPIHLSNYYPYPILADNTLIMYMGPAFLLLLAFAVYKTHKHTKVIIFGCMFFLVTISLVSQILPAGATIIADRYSYVPFIGFFFIIGSGYSWLTEQKKPSLAKLKPVANVVLAGVIIIFSYLTFIRTKVWQSTESLWTNTLENYPIPLAFNQRGNYYRNSKQYEKALSDYNSALSKDPNYNLAYINRGNVYFNLGNFDQALADYDKAMELNAQSNILRNNRGAIYFKRGQYDLAFEDFNAALATNPDYADARLNRAVYYSVKKQLVPALADYDYFLRYNHNNPMAYNWRGSINLDLQKYQEALQDFNSAIQLNPNADVFYINRSRAYQAMGNKQKATQDALKARQLGIQVGDEYLESLKK